MTWTYKPIATDLDMVRFLIGDTIVLDPLLQDEEILVLLAKYINVELASAIACDTLSAKFSRLVDVTVGKTRISYSQKADQYRAIALSLRNSITANKKLKAIPYAGGISVADKDTQDADTDRVKPDFERGMFEYPGSGFGDGSNGL